MPRSGIENSMSTGVTRPHGAKVHDRRTKMMEIVDNEEWAKVVRAVLKEAQKGDITAAKLLFDRILGKEVSPEDMIPVTEVNQRLLDIAGQMMEIMRDPDEKRQLARLLRGEEVKTIDVKGVRNA